MTLLKRDVSVHLFGSSMTQHEKEVSETTRKDAKKIFGLTKKVTYDSLGHIHA